jgi:hypothetical protein
VAFGHRRSVGRLNHPQGGVLTGCSSLLTASVIWKVQLAIGLAGGDADIVFVADDFAAWLVGLLADAGRKRLTTSLLGTDQQRAVSKAAAAAVWRMALELHPEGGAHAEDLSMVVNEVFSAHQPEAPTIGQATLLEALQAGVARQLAPLGDAHLTGTGESSAEVLGVPVEVLIEKLTSHLVEQILAAGARGEVLAPLADQLNHDLTHVQGRHLVGMVGRIAEDLRHVLAERDSAHVAKAVPAWIPPAFAGAGQALKLAIKDPQAVYDAVEVQSFTGREWLTAKLQDFLRERPCGYVWIEARARPWKDSFRGMACQDQQELVVALQPVY